MGIRTKSWVHLQELLFAEPWQPSSGRFRSNFAYRGMADTAFDWSTNLSRIGGRFPDLENHLLRNFRKYACKETRDPDSVWYWLVAQHGEVLSFHAVCADHCLSELAAVARRPASRRD
jgi:hypothetical protein